MKLDKILVLGIVACFIVAVVAVAIWMAVLFKTVRPSIPDDLRAKGFTIGQPIEATQPGIMRYPCLTPKGAICTVKYNQQGQIVEVGLMMTPGKELDSVGDIAILARLIKPDWDATAWATESIEAKTGEQAFDDVVFGINIFGGLGIFAGAKP